ALGHVCGLLRTGHPERLFHRPHLCRCPSASAWALTTVSQLLRDALLLLYPRSKMFVVHHVHCEGSDKEALAPRLPDWLHHQSANCNGRPAPPDSASTPLPQLHHTQPEKRQHMK